MIESVDTLLGQMSNPARGPLVRGLAVRTLMATYDAVRPTLTQGGHSGFTAAILINPETDDSAASYVVPSRDIRPGKLDMRGMDSYIEGIGLRDADHPLVQEPYAFAGWGAVYGHNKTFDAEGQRSLTPGMGGLVVLTDGSVVGFVWKGSEVQLSFTDDVKINPLGIAPGYKVENKKYKNNKVYSEMKRLVDAVLAAAD